MNPFVRRLWGGTRALAERSRGVGWIDFALIVGIAGILIGLSNVAGEWTGPLRPKVEIDLSAWALPRYAFYSLCRGLLAYVFSLSFTFLYGYWAAKDHRAEKILIPMLDVLQSIPVLGFMPGLVIAFVALFRSSNVGLELAAVVMIFTGQAWNMTFSFYHSLRSVPREMNEVSALYGFDWWQRVKWVELPFATIGLVWNSMMSMAGGWFFLMISESFQLGDKDYRLPGIGSYMSVAVAEGNAAAMFRAVIAMVLMIVLLDQVLWRPAVVWAQKFRADEGGHAEAMQSWFLSWLRRSGILRSASRLARRAAARTARALPAPEASRVGGRPVPTFLSTALSWIAVVALVLLLLAGAGRLVGVLRSISPRDWTDCVVAGSWTLGRVLLATALGTLWALPAGLAIGLSPRLSRILQPIVQVMASFPAPMLFPAVIAALALMGVSLSAGSVVLMLLGTQWYILFNVIAGAMTIPGDMREAAESYRIRGWQRFQAIYVPAVFPFLVTGWVTAAGGAWNASIVSEYVTFHGHAMSTRGLGAQISLAAEHADFPRLAASVVVMSVIVVAFNRVVWRNCYRLAEDRFSLTR